MWTREGNTPNFFKEIDEPNQRFSPTPYATQKFQNLKQVWEPEICGPERARTPDIFSVNEALYQLS